MVPKDLKTTPALEQWWKLKSDNYDCVLFFKVRLSEHMNSVQVLNLILFFLVGEILRNVQYGCRRWSFGTGHYLHEGIFNLKSVIYAIFRGTRKLWRSR